MPQTESQLKNKLSIPVRDETGSFTYLEMDLFGATVKHSVVTANVDKPGNLKGRPATQKKDVNVLSRHYIDAQDELDVEKFRSHEQSLRRRTAGILTEARQWQNQLDLKLRPDLADRLAKIIVSFWQDIRQRLQLREVLTRDIALGGLSLSQAQADQLLKSAVEKKEQLKKSGVQFFEPETGHSQPGPLQAASAAQLASETTVRPQPRRDFKNSSLITEIKKRGRTGKKTESILTGPKATAYQTVGPLQELEQFDLENFRRIGQGPEQAAGKVYQKVDLLADESIDLKARGIQAWQRSPLYREYLKIGHTSMDEHKPVEVVIMELHRQSPKGLSFEEFQAIADLNRSLSF